MTLMTVSATWPEAVRRLASSFLRDPVRVTVGSEDLTANSRVEQAVEVLDDARGKECVTDICFVPFLHFDHLVLCLPSSLHPSHVDTRMVP